MKNVRRLLVLWKGAAPVANFGLFKRLIITKDINTSHISHYLETLEFIGHHCEHLIVAGPVQISEHPDLNIGTGDEWGQVMERFPNVISISYERDLDMGVVESRD